MRTSTSVVLIVAAGWLASGCSQPQASEPAPAPPVRVQAVAAAAPPPGVRYSASIEPFEQVTLSFKSAGYIDHVLRRRGADGAARVVQPGDHVAAGTVLARVREADYREQVSQGRAQLAEGDAALVKAGLDLERAKTLFAADSLTKPELDAAQASYDSAAARVAAAHAQLELAASALRDTALVAPAGGVILERRIEVGTLAAAGTVAFVLGDVAAVKARFGIPDSMIQTVTLGDPIAVTVEAPAAAAFSGRVTAIAPAADPQSRVFDIEVTIPNRDGRLRPGMIGTVALGGPAAVASAQPLTVPLTAIVRSDAAAGGYAVLVIEQRDGGEVARRRPVRLGEVIGNGIAVLDGVAAGARIVISGATLLADGEPVRVVQ